MEPEYVIYESRINHLSLEELETIDPHIENAIVEKILFIANKANRTDSRAFKDVCDILTCHEQKKANRLKKYKGNLYYDSKFSIWRYEITVNGKRHRAKSSKNKEVVEASRDNLLSKLGIL